MESLQACMVVGNGSPPAGKHWFQLWKLEIVTCKCGSAMKEEGRNFSLFNFLEVHKSDCCGSSEKMGIKTAL